MGACTADTLQCVRSVTLLLQEMLKQQCWTKTTWDFTMPTEAFGSEVSLPWRSVLRLTGFKAGAELGCGLVCVGIEAVDWFLHVFLNGRVSIQAMNRVMIVQGLV